MIAPVRRTPQFIRIIKDPTKINLSKPEYLIVGGRLPTDIIKPLRGDLRGVCASYLSVLIKLQLFPKNLRYQQKDDI